MGKPGNLNVDFGHWLYDQAFEAMEFWLLGKKEIGKL